jgi:hypothetical protein
MTTPDHGGLPLPDYDHLPLPALGHRIRSLRPDEISALLGYERAHASRPQVIQIFQARLDELAAGEEPSGGGRQPGPEWPPPPAAGSPARAETAAPPTSPPPHGNPAQPARPKGNRQSG